MPRRVLLLSAAACLVLAASSQPADNDDALLENARSAYDAPFTRDLAAFDCGVQFDWKRHFEALVGTLPPSVVESVERLQKVQHRVKVNPKGAKVFSEPKAPDFGGSETVGQLEQVFTTMLTQGLNAWLPSSTNTILPVKPAKFHFEDSQAGYAVSLSGEGVEANLVLSRDLRITSGESKLPQSTRFTTHFIDGPQGYLLESVTSGPADGSSDPDTTFDYTYQSVRDIQIPSSLSISPSTTKPWHFALTGCKVVKVAKANVHPSTK